MSFMDNAKNALNSEKGEQLSDQGLDKAAEAASAKAGGQHQDKIDQARQAADGRVGNDGHADSGDADQADGQPMS